MKAFLFIFLFAALTACKKNYDCTCTNPGGSSVVFSVKETRSKAKQQCNDYYERHYGNVQFNETVCEIK